MTFLLTVYKKGVVFYMLKLLCSYYRR